VGADDRIPCVDVQQPADGLNIRANQLGQTEYLEASEAENNKNALPADSDKLLQNQLPYQTLRQRAEQL
jgi:hypothetical protein